MPTNIDGVEVKIIDREGKQKLFGYPVQAGCHAPLGDPDKLRQSREYADSHQRKVKVLELVAAVEKKYREQHPLSSEAGPGQSVGRLANIIKSIDPGTKELLYAGWSESTARATETYIINKVIPALDKIGLENVTKEALMRIETELLEKAEANGRSYKDDRTRYGVESRLYRVNLVLRRMHDLMPEVPLIQFPVSEGRRQAYSEQIKALPDHVRSKLYQILLDLAEAGDALSVAVGLIFFGNLRTGEAAAVSFCDITRDQFGFDYFFVCKRITNQGESVPNLKTGNGYRLIVLPFAFHVILHKLENALKKQGVYNNEGFILEDTRRSISCFSLAVKDLLIQAGLSEFEIASILELMRNEPDEVDGDRVLEPTAYILRRDWATRAANCCSLSNEEIDYHLGHENKAIDKKAFLDPTYRRVLAQKLERYVIDPRYSLHPGCCPVVLQDNGKAVQIDSTNRCRITSGASEKLLVRITVQTLEPGDTLSIVLPRRPKNYRVMAVPENPDLRDFRDILGQAKKMNLKRRRQSEKLQSSKRME